MSLSNAAENALGLLIFNAVTWANIADDAAASPIATFDVALHTADPGEAGTMSTNESAYTGYARQSVARTAGGWLVVAETVDNVAAITFPESTSGPETQTHFSVGKPGGGATEITVSGILDASLIVNPGITPEFAIGALNIVWN